MAKQEQPLLLNGRGDGRGRGGQWTAKGRSRRRTEKSPKKPRGTNGNSLKKVTKKGTNRTTLGSKTGREQLTLGWNIEKSLSKTVIKIKKGSDWNKKQRKPLKERNSGRKKTASYKPKSYTPM